MLTRRNAKSLGGKSAKRDRFSLLHLDEGEDYVQDWVAYGTLPPNVKFDAWAQGQRCKGRLRLLSRSIVFDADEINIPILKFPFDRIKQLVEHGLDDAGFNLTTTTFVKMKERALDAPYVFDRSQETTWRFVLAYAPLTQCLTPARELHRISKLDYTERDAVLKRSQQALEDSFHFDTSRLQDLSEKILQNFSAAQVTPLVREPGRFVVSSTRVYFQPIHNIGADSPVRNWQLATILAVTRRRHSLQPIGLEIFFLDRSSASEDGSSVMFIFRSERDRETAIRALLEQPGLGSSTGVRVSAAVAGSLLEAEGSWLGKVTAAWQSGVISNFDYLLYLNLAAGRSFNDLTQWPVVPWVLADYTSASLDLSSPTSFRDLSKPVGALNAQRLQHFRARMEQMHGTGEPPFLYGTHYSTPGYVLYWSVRSSPGHMLRLQNGRFDAPDRLFHSVSDSWDSVNTNPADVKELIPEFFSTDDAFLVNRNALPLGTKQSGEAVQDVVLPRWATSPADFLMKHRAALESDYVSSHLHHWLDLIFGYKQRGDAADKADNIFHPLTYEGAVDINSIQDPGERAGLEMQINEFGQTPRQLFHKPHPVRHCSNQYSGVEQSSGNALAVALMQTIIAVTATSAGTSPHSPHSPARAATSPGGTSLDLPVSPPVRGPHDPGLPVQVDDGNPFLPAVQKLPFQARVLEPEYEFGSRNGRPGEAASRSPKAVDMDASSIFTYATKRAEAGDSYAQVSVLRGQLKIGCFGLLSEPRGNRTGGGSARALGDAAHSSSMCGTWPETLWPQKMKGARTIRAHRGNVRALAVGVARGEEDRRMVYSCGEAVLKVRSTNLGQLPLSCLELIEGVNQGSEARRESSSSGAHPIVLAGSYDNCVYSYSVDYGRQLGMLTAHDDAVACLKFPRQSNGGGGDHLFTASWDGTVRMWAVQEGRSFTQSSWGNSRRAVAELAEHEAAVWALDVDAYGGCAVSGDEDGVVIAWDTRQQGAVWHQQVSQEAVTSLKWLPDGIHAVATCADGVVRVLDGRMEGAEAAALSCDAGLTCCAADGRLVIAGSENGEVQFWEAGKALERGGVSRPQESATLAEHKEAVSCMAVHANEDGSDCVLLTGSQVGSGPCAICHGRTSRAAHDVALVSNAAKQWQNMCIHV
ncbi:hypothetical protein CYMTET_21557 [Cymbomonas tetramitiformis]|uniref:Uncharacterized protein n=1 Tax=Cymbomonas tetramitiformis TaxID=36881 RepID=A0AAE0G1T1_9CHLO|nr:hypothetical protein CYMTET_21557 [Cymbomonas tetramitiformis]